MTNETRGTSSTILCAERRHLEAKIAECVAQMNVDSREAAKLASSTTGDAHAFQLLRTENSAVRMRLQTFRECLEFRRGWHGC